MFFKGAFLRAQLLETDFISKKHKVEELAFFQDAPWLPIAKKPFLVGFQHTENVYSSRKGNQRVGTQIASVNGLAAPGCGRLTLNWLLQIFCQ